MPQSGKTGLKSMFFSTWQKAGVSSCIISRKTVCLWKCQAGEGKSRFGPWHLQHRQQQHWLLWNRWVWRQLDWTSSRLLCSHYGPHARVTAAGPLSFPNIPHYKNNWMVSLTTKVEEGNLTKTRVTRIQEGSWSWAVWPNSRVHGKWCLTKGWTDLHHLGTQHDTWLLLEPLLSVDAEEQGLYPGVTLDIVQGNIDFVISNTSPVKCTNHFERKLKCRWQRSNQTLPSKMPVLCPWKKIVFLHISRTSRLQESRGTLPKPFKPSFGAEPSHITYTWNPRTQKAEAGESPF